MCGEDIGSCVKNLYLSSETEKDLYIRVLNIRLYMTIKNQNCSTLFAHRIH